MLRIEGLIDWYQGDPVIYGHGPGQIQEKSNGSETRAQDAVQTSGALIIQFFNRLGFNLLGNWLHH